MYIETAQNIIDVDYRIKGFKPPTAVQPEFKGAFACLIQDPEQEARSLMQQESHYDEMNEDDPFYEQPPELPDLSSAHHEMSSQSAHVKPVDANRAKWLRHRDKVVNERN